MIAATPFDHPGRTVLLSDHAIGLRMLSARVGGAGPGEEAATLEALIPAAHVLPRPIRETALAALPHHQVAHFACHGWALRTDQARSRLALHDHLMALLTVIDIGAVRLKGGLAFLSACDTAVGSPWLADEAVHITGAFHLAGHPYLIGALWRVVEDATRGIAESFYSHLTDDGANPPDASGSAEALRHRRASGRDCGFLLFQALDRLADLGKLPVEPTFDRPIPGRPHSHVLVYMFDYG